MKILVDIGHPSDVHLFKNFAFIMSKNNNQVIFTVHERWPILELLRTYKLEHKYLGKHYRSFLGKTWGLFQFNILLFIFSKRYRPDIFLSHGSMYAAHVSTALKKPHVSFEDTGDIGQIRFYKSFSQAILTPNSLILDLGQKQIHVNSYKEIAYLHPNYFKPDPTIFKYLGIDRREKYIILRFVSRDATHDIGCKGLSLDFKREVVREFSKHVKVFISSETKLPDDLKKYELNIPPHRMHDALYYATFLFGESATMASECAILGTPAIYLDKVKLCYTQEQEEKYALVFNYSLSEIDQKKSILKAIELIKMPDLKAVWFKRSQRMLMEKIDFTAFLTWFVEIFPESMRLMKTDPDYQENFKINL